MKKAADSQRGPISGRTACWGRSVKAPAGAAEASALPIPNFKAAVCRCVLLCSGALLIGGCATGSKETVVDFPGLAVSQRYPTAELNDDMPANKPGTDL